MCLPLLLAGADSMGDDVTYEGIVRPSKVVTLKAPVDEAVDELLVKQADVVEAGQVLARMDSEVQRVIVSLATHLAEDPSPVKIAELRLEDAEIRYRRLQRAYEADAANELEVLAARVARDQTSVEVEAAQRQQEQSRLRLDLESSRLEKYTVEAPFRGVVGELSTQAGASLTQDDPMIELIALDPLEASFDLPDTTYGRLAVGDEVTLNAGAPVDRALSAVVDRVVPRIDPGSRTYLVVMRIDNADQRLPSGFVVTLTLDDAPGDAASAARH
ncbi:MAG: efflux RND transporter periplasmic adaptor subunit [Planctomycetota bacterium]